MDMAKVCIMYDCSENIDHSEKYKLVQKIRHVYYVFNDEANSNWLGGLGKVLTQKVIKIL